MSFLPLAEETGSIVALTEWVLAAACKDGRSLRDKGLPCIPVAVNISPHYFRRGNFVVRMEAVLESSSLDPAGLQIEITEGVFLENKEDAIVKLRALRKMGIRTAIDDFGTGYSSLSYLKNLPVDKIKLDRSFVTDIVDNMPAAGIIRGIISMVHHLNLEVVAEGVETPGQYICLKRSHRDQYQGYLFSQPMPFADLITSLLHNEGQYLLPSADDNTAVCSEHESSNTCS